MLGDPNLSVISGLVFAAPWAAILIIPSILGLMLVTKAKLHEWFLMAGLLTLMPVVTGPIWFRLLVTLSAADLSLGEALIAVLPGIVLTGLIAIRFRRCLSGPVASAARILLILGCLRWLNSFMIGAAAALHTDSGFFVIIGISLPTVFAVVALYLSGKVGKSVRLELAAMVPVHDPKEK